LIQPHYHFWISRKKACVALLAIAVLCFPFAAGLHAQLIGPTRSLDEPQGMGLLNVLSEPPGMEVQVGGQVIGKTPIFSAEFPAGVYVLQIRDSETDIRIVAGKTIAISWFKGTFIEIPPPKSPPALDIPEEGPKPITKPKPVEKPDVQNDTPKDPFYWPLNPQGPIYPRK
jgi:hypothetical protein